MRTIGSKSWILYLQPIIWLLHFFFTHALNFVFVALLQKVTFERYHLLTYGTSNTLAINSGGVHGSELVVDDCPVGQGAARDCNDSSHHRFRSWHHCQKTSTCSSSTGSKPVSGITTNLESMYLSLLSVCVNVHNCLGTTLGR